MIAQVYSIEKWHSPESPKGERWERVTHVANRKEAERLVEILQAKDTSCYYSFFPVDQEVYTTADEYLLSLTNLRRAS